MARIGAGLSGAVIFARLGDDVRRELMPLDELLDDLHFASSAFEKVAPGDSMRCQDVADLIASRVDSASTTTM